jgi:hypothetical protein
MKIEEEIEPIQKFMDMLKKYSVPDNSLKSERVKRAMAEKAAKGYLMHKPPFGYEPSDVRGINRPNEWGELLRLIFDDIANEALDGKSAINGLIFIHQLYTGISLKKYQVIQWVSKPYYIGLVNYKGATYKGLHRPLMSAEKQQKVRDVLAQA